VYYELGLDSAATPTATVDAADIFSDRIQVTSVPFRAQRCAATV